MGNEAVGRVGVQRSEVEGVASRLWRKGRLQSVTFDEGRDKVEVVEGMAGELLKVWVRGGGRG